MVRTRGWRFLSLCLLVALVALSNHAIADSLDQSENQDEGDGEHADVGEAPGTNNNRNLQDDDHLKEKIRAAFDSSKAPSNVQPSAGLVLRCVGFSILTSD